LDVARPWVRLIAALVLLGFAVLLISGQVWLLIIFWPPLVVAVVGLVLVAEGSRSAGTLLVLVGFGQIALTFVSFSACTPFDSAPCHEGSGSWWDYWPEVVIGWLVAVSVIIGTALFSLVRRLRTQ
jgi:hypothetical protein